MKGKFNQELSRGDKIVLYYMDDISPISPGTEGTVVSVVDDPFESGNKIINVNWSDGRTLAIVSNQDIWKKIETNKINEQTDDHLFNFTLKNVDVFDHFNWRFLRSFLLKIKKSGIVNMFGVSPLLYAGKEHIERYYGEGKEDSEAFQEVLEDADRAKDEIVKGVISYMVANDKDLDNMGLVNNLAKKFAQKITYLYMIY